MPTKVLQGDVEKVIGLDGSVLASYTYDAWGQVHSASGSMAATNPIRYRGYYYDTETSLYYLQSRYYDPQTGRFLNADSYESTGQGVLGCNMFAYCLNNPIAFVDDGGSIATLTLVGYGLYFLLACCCTVLVSETAITLPAPGNPGDIGLGLSRLEIKVKKWIITIATAAVIELALSKQNEDKIIYRSDVPGQDTFVPRKGIDDDGLSFLDFPMTNHPGGYCATIKMIEGTGLFKVVPRKGGHYSIKPIVEDDLETWMREGEDSIYTKTLQNICVPYSLTKQ